MEGQIEEGFSIVLCTYNGKNRIEKTLSYIAALKIPENSSIELIIVNNASTDGTASSALHFWSELGNPFYLRIIDENRPGKGFAAELGYDAARYSYILTVDDDNWLCSDYLINAIEILQCDTEIGILQGKSVGEFEVAPPEWLNDYSRYFIIGSPIEETGYFKKNSCWVWGAGMVILKADWEYIRSKGFSFLTSKVPGKAAGEDNETAIAILLLGKKIYYSHKLKYKHFMPNDRITWRRLKNNFDVFGYVTYFFFLYSITIDSYKTDNQLSKGRILYLFIKYTFRLMKMYSFKLHLAFWLIERPLFYQLHLTQFYSLTKWFFKLWYKTPYHLRHLNKWLIPLLEENKGQFRLKLY